VLAGGPGADVVEGRGGPDTLAGGDGDDSLTGGPGTDAMSGGAGSDSFQCDEPSEALDTEPIEVVGAVCLPPPDPTPGPDPAPDPAPAPSPAPPPTGAKLARVPAPVLSGLRVSPTRIAIGSPLPKLVARPARRQVGTIRVTLSRAATVRLRFARLRPGGKPRRLKPTVRLSAKPGVNRLRFAGRLSRKVRLAPGPYRLTAVAIDAAGRPPHRSAPVSGP
jgi:RTX calcium-binding nonapeptide repeat (4 copies)